jgi:transposase
LHLYSSPDDEDPFFVVSNALFGLHLIYRLRMQIEQCFRDLKSLFGFKHLVLRKDDQDRMEMLFCLLCITMGILMMKFEKSAYRWMRGLYPKRKVYSLVRVIKRVVRDSWKELCLEPYFSLSSLSS